MTGPVLSASAPSRTGARTAELLISVEYLGAGDTAIIVDDFLGTGRTLVALADLVRRAGARLAGMGCLMEKVYEDKVSELAALDVPLVSLVRVDVEGERVRASAS